MSVSIFLGWWLVPAIFTIGAFTWAWWAGDRSPSSGYGNIGKGLANALVLAVALIASLMAWLVWAVAT